MASKTLAEWFPHNGMFMQNNKIFKNIRECSGPGTVRHHSHTTAMAHIAQVLPESHTLGSVYTAAEVKKFIVN